MNSSWIPLIILCAALLYMLMRLVRPNRRSRSRDPLAMDTPPAGAFDRDDDRFWIAGVLYNNPDDPDLFVPKRFGLGWTVNIGRPLGKVLIIGPLLLPVALAILKMLSRR